MSVRRCLFAVKIPLIGVPEAGTDKGNIMAKSQKKSTREIRKPKAEKVKTNASNPSEKRGVVSGLEHIKTGRGN